MTLIDKFYRARDARGQWEAEVIRRAEGLNITLTRDFFFHMNPIYEPQLAMRYVVGRYEAAYDALAALRPKSVLEIGCAQGLSAWLMTDYAEEVVGLEISDERVAVGRQMFPEVTWVCDDWRAYLEGCGRRFDVIVASHGPFIWDDALPDYCDNYINIGYRTWSWSEALRGTHKISGRQLSFSTTLWEKQPNMGPSSSYLKYFARLNWLKEARHALSHGYALPL